MADTPTKPTPVMTVVVRGTEDGKTVEFTTDSRETAERLAKELEEQGVRDLSITTLN